MILSIVICLALGALSVFGVAQGVEEHTQKVQAAQGVETDAPSSLAPAESQASTGADGYNAALLHQMGRV